MASFGSHHLSSFFFFFLSVLLLLSPQTQAREGKFLSFFTHFTTTRNNHAKEPQVVVVPPKIKSHPPSPAPAPAPSEYSIAAAPVPAPVPAPESIEAAPVPAPESEFVDRGDGYGLYGTTSFENNESPESFKTGYSTRLYSNYNYNNINNNNNNNEEVYRNNYYNNQEYTDNHRSNNYYQDSYYSNNKNNDRYTYNNNNYYNNNGYNGYERKREGMSDTRFVENGKYFYEVKDENQNYHYKVDGYEPTGRGSTTEKNNYGGTFYENNYSKYPNQFDTMEEYEKQQESQGYEP